MQVVLHLSDAGHAGEDHLHVVQALKPAERPGGHGLVGAQRMQLCRAVLRKIRQFAAAQGLHDPDRDAALGEQLVARLRVLKRPVQVVELNLAELHLIAVAVQEVLQAVVARVAGEAQVADAAKLFLLQEVVHDAPAGVGIGLDGLLVHVVQQVEVEVIHLALAQLLLEDGGGIVALADLMARELRGQVVAVPGIGREHAAQHGFGLSAVVGPGGVDVVHTALEGQAHHLGHLHLVHLALRVAGQAHRTEAQQGELLILKAAVDHFFLRSQPAKNARPRENLSPSQGRAQRAVQIHLCPV